MPQVSIHTSSGDALINYTISTPHDEHALRIDPSLPSVVFLHATYSSQTVFHFQFGNPKLRRFNLISLDARLHGDTIAIVPSTYRLREAAEDIFHFMEALNLPPCHFVGVAVGGCFALQLAVVHPDRVLSILTLSPLPLHEPEFVITGRQEIFDCWAHGMKDPERGDVTATLDSLFGALELVVNGYQTTFVKAIIKSTLPRVVRNWSGKHVDELYTVSIAMLLDHKPHPPSDLRKVKCPISLVHAGEDVAYSYELAEELCQYLEDAGLDVRLSQIEDAPHFSLVSHPEEVNRIVHDWIMGNVNTSVPPAPLSVTSPFEDEMNRAGLSTGSGDDSDDEDLFVVAQCGTPDKFEQPSLHSNCRVGF